MSLVYRNPMSNEWTWSKEHHFQTDTSTAKQVLDELLNQLRVAEWGEQDVFGVHLAVEEALMNAIKHGNHLDSSKRVDVITRVSPEKMRIEIEDEGSGFNPAEVPDPTDDDNLELPSGRGLMLMRSFMSKVEFNERGNRVIMEKEKSEA